jgi:microcystin-dependent protein
MAKLFPYPKFVATRAGEVLPFATLESFEAGTSTPKATFTDESGDTANDNPVVMDINGEANVWLGSGSYKLVLKDADDVEIWTVDDIEGDIVDDFAGTVVSITTTSNITAANNANFVKAEGTITLNLLAASAAGSGFYFIIRNVGSGTVTIDPNATELIDGASTVALLAGEGAVVICDGSNWFTVATIADGSITTAKIADDAVTTAKILDANVTEAKLAAAIIAKLVPAGAIQPFAMDTAPTGWLECDGSAVSRTTYSGLFTAIGTEWGVGDGSTTFNIPDFRGEFLRGWDNGKGTDSGRAFASAQLDAFQNFTGTFDTRQANADVDPTGPFSSASNGNGAANNSSGARVTFDPSTCGWG